MGVETGFRNFGFVDDREEEARWNKIDEQLSEPKTMASDKDIDGKIDIDETEEWTSDMKNREIKSYKRKEEGKKQSFLQRNKRQIIDALIVLGVIYVGYKLFFEKNDDGDMDFADGGEVDYTPTPQAPPPPPVQAPPRPEMPEPTFNGE